MIEHINKWTHKWMLEQIGWFYWVVWQYKLVQEVKRWFKKMEIVCIINFIDFAIKAAFFSTFHIAPTLLTFWDGGHSFTKEEDALWRIMNLSRLVGWNWFSLNMAGYPVKKKPIVGLDRPFYDL